MSSLSRMRGRPGGRGLTSAILGLVLMVLTGCGVSEAGKSHGIGQSAMTPPPGVASSSAGLPRSKPLWVTIPHIDAQSSLVPLGLNPDRTVQVPPVHEPMQAGWYEHGPTPGEQGPAVVLGHVNGGGDAGIFARLVELRPGDEILIGRQDGRQARFVVQRMQQVPKTNFPSDEVYGDTAGSALRLITCGGGFNATTGNYDDNIIAYATLEGSTPT